MAEIVKGLNTLRIDDDELIILLYCLGQQSPKSIAQVGHNVEVFERLYSTFAQAVYRPISEDSV